ncbi:hypothetical protein [Bergeriella denitrificans]|uniref:hypothetical protein n=1 Tax=Bergeriella denitrificans TaxID=494 RepID=UPI000E1B714B|nr:hypothetical protein [Bergeriella denitrificans]
MLIRMAAGRAARAANHGGIIPYCPAAEKARAAQRQMWQGFDLLFYANLLGRILWIFAFYFMHKGRLKNAVWIE